jgi:hypothetical protein
LSAGDAGLAAPVRKAGEPRDGTLVALSGGFDSSLLLHLAARTDTRVEAVHFRVNETVRDEEERAARAIAEVCNVPLHIVDIDAPGLVDYRSPLLNKLRRVSALQQRPPRSRPAAAAAWPPSSPAAAICAASPSVSTGNPASSAASITGGPFTATTSPPSTGSVSPPHCCATISTRPQFEAPLWSVSGYRIRRAVLDHLPQLAAALQTCYWQRWCGRCVKCVTTALLQADAVRSQVQFRNDMVDDPQNEYLTALLTPDRRVAGLPYWELATYTLERLAGTGDDRLWVRRFVEETREHHPEDLHKARQLCEAIDRRQCRALRATWLKGFLTVHRHATSSIEPRRDRCQ